jgi:tetratricopeptide (TPR) repeat protein
VFVCLAQGGCEDPPADPPEAAAHAATLDPPPDVPVSAAPARPLRGSLSFNKHIAPIVFEKCAGCHHSGEVAPFNLLSYNDVKKRARQIVEVTQKRIMPPWSPLRGYCEFERDGSLSAVEIGMLAQWFDDEAPEGDPSDLPPVPEFPQGWKYGTPDLVVRMPEPFAVAADAPSDLYRKFVIRIPIKETKYVRAFDFNPGCRGVIHHMRLRVDKSSLSRLQDEQDPLPGFDGNMLSGDTEPDGFFLGWAPGYEAVPKRADVAWTLRKGADLVLELHLHPTGKAELVQSSIALYFRPTPPREQLYLLQLSCETIDIPPGKKGQTYEDQYTLPIDTTILAIMPHAHYLATDILSWAVRPDGKKVWLIRIADWDFNWQREYVYAEPISLPKGTTLCMRVTYDNSAENGRNPRNPPRRVLVGRDTFDEMAQVYVQVLATKPGEGAVFLQDFARKNFESIPRRAQFLVDRGHGTSADYYNLACFHTSLGNLQQAILHYQESIRLKSDNLFAINNLGNIYVSLGRPEDAIKQFTRALELNPRDARVNYNLGVMYLAAERLDLAKAKFEVAVQGDPESADAWTNLGLVAMQQQQFPLAASHFERALKINPNHESARVNLRHVRDQLTKTR